MLTHVYLLQWVPLLGALGIGSLIGNYVGAGKARREVRSAVLSALATTENTRWAGQSRTGQPPFRTAARRTPESTTGGPGFG
jgi:hypothetical protein